jgi:two-component system, LytTR family, sensor kinase
MNRTMIRGILKAYLISIGVWSAMSLLNGWQYLIFDQSVNIHSTLGQMMLLAEGRGLSFALLTPPIFYIVKRFSSSTLPKIGHWVAYCLGVVPYMLIYATVRWMLVPPWSAALQRFVPRSSASPLNIIHDGFADIITIYSATVIAAHAYHYIERIRKQDIERSGYQQAIAESELQALKMQLHPHFLFNTLHGISSLIDSDGGMAKEMIVKLSGLLRVTLEQRQPDLIPLDREVKFIAQYLELESMRFGSRLTVQWRIDDDTRELLVPQLILQPLVENAIRHGIAGSRGDGWLEIASHRSNRSLELTIRNSVGTKRPGGTGLGLKNTELRVKHLYSDEATFRFVIKDDRTALAKLILPALGSPMRSENQAAPSITVGN